MGVDKTVKDESVVDVQNLPRLSRIIGEQNITIQFRVRIEIPKSPQPDDNVAPSAIEYWEIVMLEGVLFRRRISEAQYYESKL